MRAGYFFAVCFITTLFTAPSARAETKVTISKTHLCCGACVTAVDKVLAEIKGVKHQTNRTEHSISLTADSDEAAQKAIDALAKSGFHGSLDNDKLKYKTPNVPKGKVTRLELDGVHNCCGQCNTAIKKAVATVSGVKGDTAKAKETSFVVEGDFVAADVVKALNDVGFHVGVKN